MIRFRYKDVSTSHNGDSLELYLVTRVIDKPLQRRNSSKGNVMVLKTWIHVALLYSKWIYQREF